MSTENSHSWNTTMSWAPILSIFNHSITNPHESSRIRTSHATSSGAAAYHPACVAGADLGVWRSCARGLRTGAGAGQADLVWRLHAGAAYVDASGRRQGWWRAQERNA